MEHWICATCGAQFAASDEPPASCPICTDQRQYIGAHGQQWTTLDKMREQGYQNHLTQEEPRLTGIVTQPSFAIGQRALLAQTEQGNVLWDCVSYLDDATAQAIQDLGGITAIAASHPHLYGSMVDWADRFGASIYLHEADRPWVMRPDERITFWSGETLPLLGDLSLIRLGGHFPGSTALHWQDARRPAGALFPGDALQVVFDRRHVTFMYSYPNYIPMHPEDVRAMRTRLDGYEFDDVYGYTWGRNIIGGGRRAVDASFDRYLRAVGAA